MSIQVLMWINPCCLNRLHTTFPCLAVDCLAHFIVQLFPPGREKKKTNETSVVLGIVSY